MRDRDFNFLAHLEARAAQVIKAVLNVGDTQADDLAKSIALAICEDCGASTVRIHKYMVINERDKEIHAEFTGNNYLQLAFKFKLSDRRIRDIIKAVNLSYSADFRSRQQDMFPDFD